MRVDKGLKVYSGNISVAKRLIAIRGYIHLNGWGYRILQITHKRK